MASDAGKRRRTSDRAKLELGEPTTILLDERASGRVGEYIIAATDRATPTIWQTPSPAA